VYRVHIASEARKERDILQRRLYYLNKAKGDIRGRTFANNSRHDNVDDICTII
jgi:hypothetical protein